MRIFIYEYVTGGGWCFDSPPLASLLREGQAMVCALAQDFARTPSCDVVVLSDSRWPLPNLPGIRIEQSDPPGGNGNLPAVLKVAAKCDATLVIAPEFRGILSRYVGALDDGGHRLLSPPCYFVNIASDKVLTYENLQADIRMPQTSRVRCTFDGRLPTGLSYPLIVKPIDGCGSDGVQLLRSASDCIDWSFMSEHLGEVAVQDFVPGVAASVALLCGPRDIVPLPACTQQLTDDGRFQYLGGACPLPPILANRAESLARRTLWALKTDCGYIGVDLILGAAEDGSQDYVIEINPRLTTSYIGLRVLSQTNLAQAMLDVAEGREPHLAWKPGRVRWSADGAVEYLA